MYFIDPNMTFIKFLVSKSSLDVCRFTNQKKRGLGRLACFCKPVSVVCKYIPVQQTSGNPADLQTLTQGPKRSKFTLFCNKEASSQLFTFALLLRMF